MVDILPATHFTASPSLTDLLKKSVSLRGVVKIFYNIPLPPYWMEEIDGWYQMLKERRKGLCRCCSVKARWAEWNWRRGGDGSIIRCFHVKECEEREWGMWRRGNPTDILIHFSCCLSSQSTFSSALLLSSILNLLCTLPLSTHQCPPVLVPCFLSRFYLLPLFLTATHTVCISSVSQSIHPSTSVSWPVSSRLKAASSLIINIPQAFSFCLFIYFVLISLFSPLSPPQSLPPLVQWARSHNIFPPLFFHGFSHCSPSLCLLSSFHHYAFEALVKKFPPSSTSM